MILFFHLEVVVLTIQKININGEKVYVNIKALRKAPNNTIREKAKKDGMEFARYYRITPVIEKEIADNASAFLSAADRMQ